MSRIHEALKKAEQERATSESIPQIVADQVVLEAIASSEMSKITGGMGGAGLGL